MSRPSGNNRSDSLYREYVSLLNRRTFVTGAMAVTAFSASPKFAQAQSNLATQFVTAASGNGLQLQVLSIPIYTPGSNGSPQLAYQDFKGIWHTPSNVLSTPSPLSYLLAQNASDSTVQVIALPQFISTPPILFSQTSGGNWVSQDSSDNWPTNSAIPIAPYPTTQFKNVQASVGANNVLEVVFLSSHDNFVNLVHQHPNKGSDNAEGAWAPFNHGPSGNANQIDSQGTQFSTVAMAAGNRFGSLQLIGIGKQDGKPYLMWQDPATLITDGSFPFQVGQWNWAGQLLPQSTANLTFTAVALGRSASGPLQVVLMGDDGQPYLIWQDNSGNWYWYGALPNPGKVEFSTSTNAIVMANGNSQSQPETLRYLQVIFIGTDGFPHLIWQDNSGNWYPYSNPSSANSNILYTGGVQLGALVAGYSPNLNTPQDPPLPLLSIVGASSNTNGSGTLYWLPQDGSGNWTWKGPIHEGLS